MSNHLTAEAMINIDAPTDEVWHAITTPEIVKQYLFGTTVVTDWKEGSPISYEGEYNGKAYKDKGVIKKIEPGRIFQSTYWSSMGGKEDKPENYNLVTYKLADDGGKTVVKLTQNNVRSEEELKHTTDNWTMVLKKLKEVIEGE